MADPGFCKQSYNALQESVFEVYAKPPQGGAFDRPSSYVFVYLTDNVAPLFAHSKFHTDAVRSPDKEATTGWPVATKSATGVHTFHAEQSNLHAIFYMQAQFLGTP